MTLVHKKKIKFLNFSKSSQIFLGPKPVKIVENLFFIIWSADPFLDSGSHTEQGTLGEDFWPSIIIVHVMVTLSIWLSYDG